MHTRPINGQACLSCGDLQVPVVANAAQRAEGDGAGQQRTVHGAERCGSSVNGDHDGGAGEENVHWTAAPVCQSAL